MSKINKNTAFCFDLDGTITAEESLPMLAKHLELFSEEIHLLTKATLDGVIPVKSSLKLRFSLLLQADIKKIRKIMCKISLHHKILRWISAHSQDCYIITHNLDLFCEHLLTKIPCKSFTSKIIKEDTHSQFDLLDKGDIVREIKNYGYNQVVAIGEGFGDLPMFENADIRISFGAVHKPIPKLLDISDYISYSEETLCQILNMLYYPTLG